MTQIINQNYGWFSKGYWMWRTVSNWTRPPICFLHEELKVNTRKSCGLIRRWLLWLWNSLQKQLIRLTSHRNSASHSCYYQTARTSYASSLWSSRSTQETSSWLSVRSTSYSSPASAYCDAFGPKDGCKRLVQACRIQLEDRLVPVPLSATALLKLGDSAVCF